MDNTAAMLDGIRVIELGTAITAPLAGMMLADLGADVIKVERPGGDAFRRVYGDNYGPTFVAYNRNKRGIVLDLGAAGERDGLRSLVKRADVLLDNFRPGVLARLGLEPDRLRQENPRLIQCSITGFGETGPYRDRPALDSVGQALSGIASLLVDPADPEALGPTISDNVTGMYAAYAILAALVERGRTGRGRRLEVNMLEASMAFIPDAFTKYTRLGQGTDRYSRVAGSQCFALKCRDGTLVAVHLSTSEAFWKALVEAMEAPDLAADDRFSSYASRLRHYAALREALAKRFALRDRADWLARLARHDVPSAPILSVAEVVQDPQVAALQSLVRTVHPTEGSVTSVNCPVRVDGRRPLEPMRPAPSVGEHTEEVFAALGIKVPTGAGE